MMLGTHDGLSILPTERTAKMQSLIDKFAHTFMSQFPGMSESLRTLLSGRGQKGEPSFTVQEARDLLASRSGRLNEDLESLLGITGEATVNPHRKRGFPILQLYDFIFTLELVIDTLQREKRMASEHNPSVATMQSLRKRYLPPDWRPEFYQAFRRNRFDPIDRTIGQQIGSPEIYDPIEQVPVFWWIYPGTNAAANPIKPIVRRKTDYELSVEEAYLLGFDTYNDIVALSQGLFRIFSSASNATRALPRVAGDDPNTGHWINTFGNHANTGYWEPNRGRLEYRAVTGLQPKCTLLGCYSNNRYMREVGSTRVDIPDELYGTYSQVSALRMWHVQTGFNQRPFRGGAMGRLMNVIDDQGRITPVGPIPVAAILGFFNRKVNPRFNDPEYQALYAGRGADVGPGLHALEVPHRAWRYSEEDIYKQMRSQRYRHAIWACADLAETVKKTNLDEALFNFYKENAALVWKKIREVDEKKAYIRALIPRPLATCDDGSKPYFRGSDGKVFVGDEAFMTVNGVRIFRPDALPETASCDYIVQEKRQPASL